MIMMGRKILSLTLNELINSSLDDILKMLKDNLDEVSNYDQEYALSIASAIVKRVLLVKNFSHQYEKVYKIIFSPEFKDSKVIYDVLERENLGNLKDLFDIYKDGDIAPLIDSLFMEDERMFEELVLKEEYNIKDVFSEHILNSFYHDSYKRFLSYLLKDNDKSRVIKALIKGKNNKFIYMVSRMDDVVLKHVKDDSDFFDAVLTLLNHNDYRKLLWDYYNKFVGNKDIVNYFDDDDEDPDELKELINYTFNLMSVIYSMDKVPDIISSVEELVETFNAGKDMVHVAVFGVEGYKKFINGTFDVMIDFPKIEDDNYLLNLKIAFFSTIYGLTYNQAEKLIKNFDSFMKEFNGTFSEGDQLIYETIVAMKSLYELTLEDKEEIDLYREVYYKYLKKNGIYASVEVEALVLMEGLMRRMYNNSIEIL